MRARLLAVLFTSTLAISACAEDETKDDDDSTETDTDVDTDDDDGSETDTEDDAVDCEIGLLEGDCAPDFTLPDADGTDRALSDFAGQRVVVIGTAEW
jgi:hypothetical protein